MTYTPYLDWKNGPSGATPITAEQLIRIEQGIADSEPSGLSDTTKTAISASIVAVGGDAFAEQAKTTAGPQAAIDTGASSNVEVFVTPGTHTVNRSTTGDLNALAITAPTSLRGHRQGSSIALDAAETPQSTLSHFLRLGSTDGFGGGITIENLNLDVNQNLINKFSFIVNRQVESTNAYCTVVTATAHGLSVGDSITIANTELAALNGAHTVSEVPSATSFRVTGVSSSNHAVVTQTNGATVQLTGSASIDGITALLASTATTGVDHVRVRHVTINNTSNAVRATITRSGEGTVKHHDWLVEDCQGDTFTNKVVEFAYVDGGKLIDCHFTGCNDGPQAIFYSKNIEFRYNMIGYVWDGINLASGVHDIRLIGNIVEAQSNLPVGAAGPALVFRTENTSGVAYDCYNVLSRGNVYRNRVSTAQVAMRFSTLSAVTSATYRDMRFEGDTFDGVVYLYDVSTPAKTTIHGLTFTGCKIGSLITVPYATCKVYDTVFRDVDFTDATKITIHASDMQFINCTFAGDVEIAADAADVVMTGCVSPTAIVDNGTRSTLSGNRIDASYPA